MPTEVDFDIPFDPHQAEVDPEYALAWSKHFYTIEVGLLADLVDSHITAGYIGASSFVTALITQSQLIAVKLGNIQTDIDRVTKKNNTGWV